MLGDILKHSPCIMKQIKALRTSHSDFSKVPTVRRQNYFFKKKEESFLDSLKMLFDITVKFLQSSNMIADEDRDVLQNHWDKTVSSTPDLHLKQKIDYKIAREESRQRYSERQSSPDVVSLESSDESQLDISLHKEYTPNVPVSPGKLRWKYPRDS